MPAMDRFKPQTWLISTIGKRGYLARYLRESLPAGSRIIGTGNERWTTGFASCDEAFLMPAILDEEYPDQFLELCRREQVDAVITASDLDLQILPRLRSELTGLGIACFFPGADAATTFLDKYKTAQFCNANGILTPRTYNNVEVSLESLSLPFIVKPANGSASSGVRLIETREACLQHWKDIDSPIAQEYVQGKLVNVEACSSLSGEVMAISAWERRSSIDGETLLAETIEHADAFDLAKAILTLLPIQGPVDMDLIENEQGLYLLEVNTRFGGGYPTSHLAGADFTGAMMRSLQGILPSSPQTCQPGVLMMKDLNPIPFQKVEVDGRYVR